MPDRLSFTKAKLPPTMTSFFSSVLTSTTSRYNNLRKTLLSDETDGDTEDDSHISRVLRAYYLEKGRQLPSWLPPDPKTVQAAPSQHPQLPRQQSQQSQQSLPRRSGGLSDLWDNPPEQSAPQSLRRSDATHLRVPPLQASRADSYNSAPSLQRLTPGGARPLPSQREGSYQSQASLRRSSRDTDAPPTPPIGVGQGASAQDRLKARLWGGRSGSGQGSTQPPFDRGGSYG